jgi:hypothetical protein
VGAEGHIPGSLLHIDAEFGFKPLAVFVDKADQSNGRAADVGGKADYFVEGWLQAPYRESGTAAGQLAALFRWEGGELWA